MRESTALPQPGDVIAGKYVLERVIGQGGMSVVYGATHRVTGKRFAIKWLLPEETPSAGETARRFIREAQMAGLFQHPNVVEVYDVGQVSGSFYMVMEWLEGESLAARLERVGTMSFADVCAYLIPCMHGVVEAHTAGIVHRDLKPANIFLCRAMHHTPEKPKVLDFGIAKMAKHQFDVNSLVTKSGVLIGTPHYLSPEQLRSQPIDHRTDIYALGVIMYQLLSGKLPFPAENFGQLVLQIATDTPVPLRELAPDLPEGVEALVARAMAREPAERFQDVRELIEALEQLGGVPLAAALPRSGSSPLPLPASRATPTPQATSAPPPAPAQPPEAPRAGRTLAYLSLAAASIALIGGGILLARLWTQPPSAAVEPATVGPSRTPPAPSSPKPDPITTTSAATTPAAETAAAKPAEAAPAEPPTAPAASGSGAHDVTNAPRTKRPARPAPPPTATPVTPPEAPAPVTPPTPPPASPRNPLDMRLQ